MTNKSFKPLEFQAKKIVIFCGGRMAPAPVGVVIGDTLTPHTLDVLAPRL